MIDSPLTSSAARCRRGIRESCILLMAAVLTLGACEDQPSPTDLSSDGALGSLAEGTRGDGRLSRTYGGRDLFRGLLLSDGPVAEALPELVQGYDRDEAYSRKVREIMVLIDRSSPEFFDRFGKQLNSGDRHKIALALEQGADQLFDALDLYDQDLELTGELAFADPGVGIAVALPVVVVVWKWTWVYSDLADPTISQLEFEKVVDKLAFALGV